MDISSLTTVTSSSTRNSGSNASANTASAPFADVMQRAAADTPEPSGGGDSNPALASSSAEAQATPAEANTLSARGESSARRESDVDVAADGNSQTPADAGQILQALASGDMSGLHSALAALAGEGKSPKVGSDGADGTKLSDILGDDATALSAQGLAAMVAALPQIATASSVRDANASLSGGGIGRAGASQGILQSMIIDSSDGARGLVSASHGLTSDDAPTLANGEGMTGASTRVNASLFQSHPAGISAVMSGNSGAGLVGSNGQPLSAIDTSGAVTLNGAVADATAGTGLAQADLDGLDVTTLANGRTDTGSLASLTSSLSNSASAATTAATPTNATITTSLQSPQWPASFGQQVLQMHQRGDQQMSLRLHPQELGPLSVSLTVQDQQAQLQILSAHAPVRAAVEAAIPQLRQALADSGIALGEAMVGDQGMFQQGQSQQGQSSDGDGSRRAVDTAGVLLASGSLDAGSLDSADELTSRQIAITTNGNISLYA